MAVPTRTSREVWDGLREAYGLDPTGYDVDLADLIRDELGLGAGDIDVLLGRYQVSIEALLDVVLRSVLPFAGMLTDLLRMFEQAAATRADRANLLVSYDFGGADGEWTFLLDTFRTWVETVGSVVSLARVPQWTPDQLALLHGAVRAYTAGEHPLSATVAVWSEEYDQGRWPYVLPVLPQTGDNDLDRQVRSARSMVAAFIELCRSQGVNRAALQQVEPDSMLARYDHDRWPEEVLRGLDRLVAAHSVGSGLDAALLTARLANATRPAGAADVERLMPSIEEVLSLPAWKKRHELYAAWMLTLIVDAAGPKLAALHPTPDGKLSFSFAGSHVATITTHRYGPVFVMAELRSPLARPVGRGRKAGIQPDYVLVTPPVTAASSAIAVIECKQYRRASPTNFGSALRDYAAGHPNARVLLANYGPGQAAILDRVPLPDRSRCVLLPHLRPDNAQERQRLRTELRQVLDLDPVQVSISADGSAWATVQLSWTPDPMDLDLHVSGCMEDSDLPWKIDFENRGSAESHPFAWLDRDVIDGSEPETVTVTRPAEFTIVVKQFSDRGTLGGSAARVSITTPIVDVVLSYPPSRDPYAREWLVGEVLSDGSLVVG